MSASRYHNLAVQSVIDETDDARSLIFSIPEELAEAYRYRPGQFLTLRLPWEGRHLLRCYSMSSAPELDSAPRVTIKRVKDGRGSNWICDHVSPGDTLEVMQPAGVFVPTSYDCDFLLCAGGSGITPVFSILRSVLKYGKGRIRLLYANQNEASVIFRESLKSLTAEHPERLEVIHLLDSVQGIPSTELLARLAEPMVKAEAFICGPGPYMDAVETALGQIGMDPDQIHIERFVSLPDEETRDAAAVAAHGKLAKVDSASVSIELDGQVHEITCFGDETLLEAAEKAGLELPYSCKSGMCASCKCELMEGEVKLRHNEVLDEHDLAKSLILSCQAVPLTPRIRIRYT